MMPLPFNEPRPIEIFIPEIRELIRDKKLDELKALLSELNPIDIADGLAHFPPEQAVLIFRLLEPSRANEVFSELDVPQQEYLLQHLSDQAISPLLEGVAPEITASLFKTLPERFVNRMRRLMRQEKVQVVENILEYPPDKVGAVMKTEFIPLGPDMTARSALERIQASSRLRKSDLIIHSLYVSNGNGRLVGGLTLQALISAPADIRIRDIMAPVKTIRISVDMDQEDAAKIFSRYKLLTAPVVDEAGRLVGILTAEHIIDIIEKENTEDIQKMGGVEFLDEPYFKVSFRKMIQKRATWLCVLFMGEMLTATAMGFFEEELARAVVLALFIPLIISSGGNSGSQAATLIVRAMALKEISFGDWWKVLKREFLSGLFLGAVLGMFGFLRIFVWSHFTNVYGPHSFLIALAVGFSLVLVVLWGTLSGSLLPIGLKRLGLDPAVASAPFVATLVDVFGILIYFSIAFFLLEGTLL